MAGEIVQAFAGTATRQNGAVIQSTPAILRFLTRVLHLKPRPIVEVETASERWSNALSFGLQAPVRNVDDNDSVIIECRVRVAHGVVGIGVTARDGSTFLSKEHVVSAGGTSKVRIFIETPAEAHHLTFRNVAKGSSSRVEILELRAYRKKDARRLPNPWGADGSSVISIAELERVLDWADDIWDTPFPRTRAAVDGELRIVDVEALPKFLGGSLPIHTGPEYRDKPLAEWKMEKDDAPILEWLWRTHAPQRHLEFGTWEGFGTTLVARVTDAEIWTVNLPGGESTNDGASLYAATDTGTNIGRLYREAGFASRVHQLLCDSRDLDTSEFQPDFFDSALIDGGHTPDVVHNDTEKALRTLRAGGLCVWHDFCPEPATLGRNLAPVGVVQAIVAHYGEWRHHFREMFWIRKSWILVGIKK